MNSRCLSIQNIALSGSLSLALSLSGSLSACVPISGAHQLPSILVALPSWRNRLNDAVEKQPLLAIRTLLCHRLVLLATFYPRLYSHRSLRYRAARFCFDFDCCFLPVFSRVLILVIFTLTALIGNLPYRPNNIRPKSPSFANRDRASVPLSSRSIYVQTEHGLSGRQQCRS